MSKNSMLAECRKHLGYKEGRNNDTVFGRWYTKQVGRQYNWQPWCAMFISYCADKSGNANVIPRHAFTSSGAQWFKDRGQWHSKPQVGDIVYFDLSRKGRISHVGIVEKVHRAGYFTSIEGNTDANGSRTGGQVMRRRRRNVGRRGGFGRPKYEGARAMKPGERTIQRGSVGEDVKALQKMLPGLVADGDFGPKTAEAVVKWQAANGLEADGVVGPKTWAALLRPDPEAPAKPAPAPKPVPANDLEKRIAALEEEVAKLKNQSNDVAKDVVAELVKRMAA